MASFLRRPHLLAGLLLWLVALPLVAATARPLDWAGASHLHAPLSGQNPAENEESSGQDGEDCKGKCGEQIEVKGLKQRRLRIPLHADTTLAWATRIAEVPAATSPRRPADDEPISFLEHVASSLGHRGPPATG